MVGWIFPSCLPITVAISRVHCFAVFHQDTHGFYLCRVYNYYYAEWNMEDESSVAYFSLARAIVMRPKSCCVYYYCRRKLCNRFLFHRFLALAEGRDYHTWDIICYRLFTMMRIHSFFIYDKQYVALTIFLFRNKFIDFGAIACFCIFMFAFKFFFTNSVLNTK